MKSINVDFQKATIVSSGSGIFFSSLGSMLGAPVKLEVVLAIIGVFAGIFLVIKSPPRKNKVQDESIGTIKIYDQDDYILAKLDDPPIEATGDSVAEVLQILSERVDEFGRHATDAILTELQNIEDQ